MPVFQLIDDLIFPPPQMARGDGLLAVGGDLSPARLLLAYSLGIFPWYTELEPILWWAPDPRLVLPPAEIHVSRRLGRTIRQHRFAVSFDTDFAAVIDACGQTRVESGAGTWITDEMKQAYLALHALGHAHSVECWRNGELVGGLYGVALGKIFFGESMFSREPDSSKVALVSLAQLLADWDFSLIDCQVRTAHLMRLGAREIPAEDFYAILKEAGARPGRIGSWTGAEQKTTK